MSLDSLFMQCVVALGEIELNEAYIKKDQANTRYYGLQEPGRVWVNPVTAIVDYLLHEMIHEVRPKWSEATVAGMTTRLMQKLTDAQILEFYRIYQDRKIERAGVVDANQ